MWCRLCAIIVVILLLSIFLYEEDKTLLGAPEESVTYLIGDCKVRVYYPKDLDRYWSDDNIILLIEEGERWLKPVVEDLEGCNVNYRSIKAFYDAIPERNVPELLHPLVTLVYGGNENSKQIAMAVLLKMLGYYVELYDNNGVLSLKTLCERDQEVVLCSVGRGGKGSVVLVFQGVPLKYGEETHSIRKTSVLEDSEVNYPSIDSWEGDNIIKVRYSFPFGDRECNITLFIPEGLYFAAKNTDRYVYTTCYEDICAEVNWTLFWQRMALDPQQRGVIQQLVEELRRCTSSEEELVEIATVFVQTIPYDWDMLREDPIGNRYPVEVLVDNKGVCGGKSLLLGAILYHAGYRASLLEFEKENHMGVGVVCPCPDFGEYCFLETTTPVGGMGYEKGEYVGGVRLHSDPLVIPLIGGSKVYPRCPHDVDPLFIKERLRTFFEEMGLRYSYTLERSFDDEYLPYGYEDGIVWTFMVPASPWPFVRVNMEYCYIKGACDENADTSFYEDIKRYEEFALRVSKEGEELQVEVYLAR